MINIDYTDIVLQPTYGEIRSRDDLFTHTSFLGRALKNPVIPANMACTSSFELAEKLNKTGYFYILHRFYDYGLIYEWLMGEYVDLISLSVGVKEQDFAFVQELGHKFKVDFLTIDVAHGHHILVKEMAEHIKRKCPKTKIIAGNVSSKEACQDYKKWGIHAAKVGLSRGKACSTYNQTGVGSFMFSTILECAKAKLPLIADGGIRTIGDISKALVAGANMVMVGSLFAACNDSPCDEYKPYPDLDISYKVYYGSASAKNKGHNKYVEGEDAIWLTKNNLSYLEFMDKINQGLVSTMSYGNFKNIGDLNKMKYLYK